MSEESLDQIGLRHKTDKASSHHGYTPIYESYFSSIRKNPISILEIGVQFGNSLKMWSDYFPRATISGVDILSEFTPTNQRISLSVGDQGSIGFWKIYASGKAWDIIVDDGCHVIGPQKSSFTMLWDHVNGGGFYVIEDIYTWWDSHFNADIVPAGQWIWEMIASLNLHGKAYHGKPMKITNMVLNEWEKTIEFIHFHPGLVIFKKK